MSFRVPDSSSPPSTPDHPRRRRSDDHPSTTPAGPPPPTSLTAFSTTPAGNPPASSFLGAESDASGIPFPSFTNRNRHNAGSTPLRTRQQYGEDSQEEEEEEEEEYEGDHDAMDEDIPPQHEHDLVRYSSESLDGLFSGAQALNLHAIAKGLANPALLREPDWVTLRTEELLHRAFESSDQYSLPDTQHLNSVVQALLDIWSPAFPFTVTTERIGPSNKTERTSVAVFVASLILRLHHPPTPSKHSRSQATSRQYTEPTPQILLEWLQRHHWPLKDDFESCFGCEPNPLAHPRFWDVLYNTTMRGDIRSALELLQSADLSHAATAFDDGAPGHGYEGKQLVNSRMVFERAIEVLQHCPALQSENWNVTGAEWAIFRRRVQQALSDLESFAEGNSADRYSTSDSNFEASHFGMTSSDGRGQSMSQRSRQAESKVPWTIYENLKYFYGQLLGTQSEVIAASIDWLEATIGITAWWNGDDENDIRQDMTSSRRFNKPMRRYNDRLVDTHPQAAYFRKLSQALVAVQMGQSDQVEDADLEIDPTDPVEIALGCVITGELDGLIRILKGWSPVIASAVVEIADMGRWLGRARPSGDMSDGFNQSDLMVLSYAQDRGQASDHDTALSQFAELLAGHSQLKDGAVVREGWQLAIEVLGRLHDEHAGAKRIGELLNELDIRDAPQVDETVQLCNRMGLYEQSKRVSERFGDRLSEQTQAYGSAIYHYARATALHKIKDLLDLLISLSLVQSIAYPPTDELDETLQALVHTPRQTIAKLNIIDPDMSASLLRHLSGYATLRRYYDLRDQGLNPKEGRTAHLRPIARKQEALSNLLGLIQSASDSIHGGLYDNSADPAVPVTALLVLLAETLPFINHPKALLTHAQTMVILKAVEDLATVSSTITDPCEECFKSAIASAHGSAPPSPRSTLKKSISNLSGSQFSLVGSDMLSRSQSKTGASNSGVLVKGSVRRAWDWRQGFERNATGEDVLKILRLGLSKELSRTWIRGEQ